MTTAIAKRIVNAFEMLNLTPEQIAEQEQVALSIVKTVLFQSSSVFRKEAKKDKSIRYTEDEAREMRDLILKQARETEDEHLAAKNAKWIVDDYEGRHDADNPRMNTLPNVQVLNFNMMHERALAAIKRTQEKAVEITSAITQSGQIEELAMRK